jgi:hypothetical protein
MRKPLPEYTRPVNETPEVKCCFDVQSGDKTTAMDQEFMAFTKQCCRDGGIVAVGCKPAEKLFYVRATKEGRYAFHRIPGGNTWHCHDGTEFRIDVLSVK